MIHLQKKYNIDQCGGGSLYYYYKVTGFVRREEAKIDE